MSQDDSRDLIPAARPVSSPVVETTALNASRRLRAALETTTAGRRAASLQPAVERLGREYRAATSPLQPVLASRVDVTAYAVVRMPATFAATWSALRQVQLSLGSVQLASVVDVGAGTGAASWAAVDVFRPSGVTLLEQQEVAIELGRALAAQSGSPPLVGASWRSWHLTPSSEELPRADMVVSSYLLGELDEPGRRTLVQHAARAAPVVVLLDSGTPGGFARVAAARAQLVELGMSIVAPCTHEEPCPLTGTGDWCHFAARLERSALHRRLKGADLAYEDEKFSFVAAAREVELDRGESRILRHPWIRKGMVSLELCNSAGVVEHRVVSRRQPDALRVARDARWGDTWPVRPVSEEDPRAAP